MLAFRIAVNFLAYKVPLNGNKQKKQLNITLLTAFHQRVLVLAFCTLLEVSRRFFEHLYPDMGIHLDDTKFSFYYPRNFNYTKLFENNLVCVKLH